jgi:predicted nucleic acid-binding protein
MPAAEALLDSNILIYALSDAPDERLKRERALHLIATEDFGTSYQVIMETWVVATRKMARKVKPEKVAAFLESILVFPCVFGTAGLYRQAVRISTRYEVHPYDAAIIAAAQELGAVRVISEDLAHGQIYDGITVQNPFRELRAKGPA